MPIRAAQLLITLLQLFLFTSSSLIAVEPGWKPERVPGSAQLRLDELAALVVPAEPSASLQAAVADLVEAWPVPLTRIEPGRILPKQALVFVRETRGQDENTGFDEGGFRIHRERTRVFLSAASDEGLVNGIYAICADWLGLRWYWPGEIGKEWTGEVALTVPDRIRIERPGFVQRTLYPTESDYGRRNRLNRKFSFNHNLGRIFSREVFETNPEAFSEIGGRRRSPRGNAGTDPQPDFSEPAAVELAAQAARAHFEENPGANSFSLSINDNSLYDESEATANIISPVEYFRGRPNYTDLVFGFMNQVAEAVSDREEARVTRSGLLGGILPSGASVSENLGSVPYLTALAYYTTEQSPSFRIHPRIMPVLTSDRAQWHDPEYRAEDKALIRRWVESGAERIATWDYYFGAPYPYPRQFVQWIRASISFLHEQGVDVFFSQLPAVWGLDGPKAWLTARLLWDPDQNADALLDEFYTNFFGPAAGPIRQFYELAEKWRDENEGPANWIKFYNDEAGVELFDPETLQTMRGFIEEAKSLTQEMKASSSEAAGSVRSEHDSEWERRGLAPDRFAQRVKIVSEAFGYTERYAAYHSRRINLVGLSLAALNPGPSEHDGPGTEAIVDAIGHYETARAAFVEFGQRLAMDPMHDRFATFNRMLQSCPLPLARAATRKFETIGHPLMKNPSFTSSGVEQRNFLGPDIPRVEDWAIQYRASDGLRVIAARGSENSGLRIENADIVTLQQTIPVLAERDYILEIEAGWHVSPDNRTRIQLDWRSITGDRLRTEIILRIPTGSVRERQRLAFLLKSPVNAYDLDLGIVTNRQYPADFFELHRAGLRQVRLLD